MVCISQKSCLSYHIFIWFFLGLGSQTGVLKQLQSGTWFAQNWEFFFAQEGRESVWDPQLKLPRREYHSMLKISEILSCSWKLPYCIWLC